MKRPRPKSWWKRHKQITAHLAWRDMRYMLAGLRAAGLPASLRCLVLLEREFGGKANLVLWEMGRQALRVADAHARARWEERVGQYIKRFKREERDAWREYLDRVRVEVERVRAGGSVRVDSLQEAAAVIRGVLALEGK